MYFTDDSLFPENMDPLIITAAPYGPSWLPGDADIPLTWEEQTQAAVDCYNAGATVLHFHVRNPETGQGSVNFEHYNHMLARIKQAVPKMIIQVGGSISFAPHSADEKAKWLDYDTRHMLTELNPKPEFVTVATGTTQWDIITMFTPDDVKGTHLDDPKVAEAWSGMWVDAGPKFYIEHLKRLRANGIQPYFVPAHVHQLEIIERLVRAGVYMGPLNMAAASYGGGTMGRNPFDWMEFIRRTPHGTSTLTCWTSMRGLIPMASLFMVLGLHIRVGNEDNLWAAKGERATTVQQVEAIVRLAKQFRRPVATAEEARKLMKVGVWYNSVEETLKNLSLPPMRRDGEKGFLAYDTDGKKGRGPLGGDSHPMAYCMVPPEYANKP
jgi:uncharacterized protein (DUF849 family)